MIDKYMIDSSVWINYFRDKNYEFTPFIKELMEKDQVYINGIIQIELLKGALFRIHVDKDVVYAGFPGFTPVACAGYSYLCIRYRFLFYTFFRQ